MVLTQTGKASLVRMLTALKILTESKILTEQSERQERQEASALEHLTHNQYGH